MDLLQWLAAASTVLGAWLVGSQHAGRRRAAFWTYLASNVMWVAWGLPASAYGLVTLQFCLAALNIRGMVKADAVAEQDEGKS